MGHHTAAARVKNPQILKKLKQALEKVPKETRYWQDCHKSGSNNGAVKNSQ